MEPGSTRRSRGGGRDGHSKVSGDNAADLLIGRLVEWGVDTMFGLPRDGINGIMEALRKRQDKIRFIHLVGTCRMGASLADSVVDKWCRSWDVPNLFVCDGNVLPTHGSANPALTISALAARAAD